MHNVITKNDQDVGIIDCVSALQVLVCNGAVCVLMWERDDCGSYFCRITGDAADKLHGGYDD